MIDDHRKINKIPFWSIRWQTLFAYTIVFALIFFAVFYWLFNLIEKIALDNLFADLEEIPRNVAAEIDGDLHQALYEDPDYDPTLEWPRGMSAPRYWQIAHKLNDYHLSNPKTLLYTYISPEPGKVVFVVSMGPFLEPVIGARLGDEYWPQPPSVILNGLVEETVSKKIVTDSYGSWVSGFAPFYNSDEQIVGAVGVDYRADTVIEVRNRMLRLAIPSFIIAYLIVLIAVLSITNRITKPLSEISKAAERIGSGDYTIIQRENIRYRDEISTLTDVFNIMVKQVESREEKLIEFAERLHSLNQIYLDKQEEERTTLARNIHDDLLNQIAAFSMRTLSTDSDEFDEIYQGLTTRMRQMITSLRPANLWYGLWYALDEYVEEVTGRLDNEAFVFLDIQATDIRYDVKTEEHLYRIVQQACENSLRHAQAKTIRIYGSLAHDSVSLNVEDDGIGFDLEVLDFDTLLSNKHFGLAGMYERAGIIGADLEMESTPGAGMKISLQWQPEDIGGT